MSLFTAPVNSCVSALEPHFIALPVILKRGPVNVSPLPAARMFSLCVQHGGVGWAVQEEGGFF